MHAEQVDFRAFFSVLVCPLVLTSWVESRTWTDTQGRTLEAELVSVAEKSVSVRRDGSGDLVELPFSLLSEEDLEWIAKQAAVSSEPNEEQLDDSGEADSGEPENWDAPFPTSVKVAEEVEISEEYEGGSNPKWIYRSNHYEFICDVELTRSVVSQFASMFEATRDYMKALPINSRRAFRDPGENRLRVLLFDTQAAYLENGGMLGAAGSYHPRTNEVKIPLISLGVKDLGSRKMLDRDKGNKTLPHELCHQLTDSVYYEHGSRGWFTEGLAEFVGVTPYRAGRFNVRGIDKKVKDYVTYVDDDTRRGRLLGETIRCQDLKDYMLLSYDHFREDAGHNYGVGALLVTYFLLWDDEGNRGPITKFLKALKAGKVGEEALAELRDGRTFEELEEQIAKAWKRKGVELIFE